MSILDLDDDAIRRIAEELEWPFVMRMAHTSLARAIGPTRSALRFVPVLPNRLVAWALQLPRPHDIRTERLRRLEEVLDAERVIDVYHSDRTRAGCRATVRRVFRDHVVGHPNPFILNPFDAMTELWFRCRVDDHGKTRFALRYYVSRRREIEHVLNW